MGSHTTNLILNYIMKYITILFFTLITFTISAQDMDYTTSFEKDPNSTPTYQETIAYYENLVKAFPDKMQLTPHGNTDAGYPLHLSLIHI